jgi:hypothetical protein
MQAHLVQGMEGKSEEETRLTPVRKVAGSSWSN